MSEKEVCLDLSKKIKWNNHYISIGTLLLSGLILITQVFAMGWSWWLFLNFLYSIRSEKNNKEVEQNEILE